MDCVRALAPSPFNEAILFTDWHPGHWGDAKTGYYYNGIHHDDLLASGKLGIESESPATPECF